jgi:hypothetical protein
MESGFTVRGTQVVPRSPMIPGIPKFSQSWKMTVGGGTVAIEKVVTEVDLKYQDPDKVRGVSRDSSLDACWYSLPTKQYNYYGPDLGGIFREHSQYTISRNDEVLRTGKAHDVKVFGADDTDYRRDRKEILWSLGRGYSDYITEITDVIAIGEDQLSVTASGQRAEGDLGRWELVIDKKAAWMIRHARFYPSKRPKTVRLEVRNEGLVWNGNLAMPTKSMCNYVSSLDDNSIYSTIDTGFKEINADVDKELIAQARKAVQPPYPPKTYLNIFRGSKLIHSALGGGEEIGRQGLTELNNSEETQQKASPEERELATPADSNQTVVLKLDESDTPPPEVPARPWYILPRPVAYVVLVLCIICGIFLLAKRGSKTEKGVEREGEGD